MMVILRVLCVQVNRACERQERRVTPWGVRGIPFREVCGRWALGNGPVLGARATLPSRLKTFLVFSHCFVRLLHTRWITVSR